MKLHKFLLIKQNNSWWESCLTCNRIESKLFSVYFAAIKKYWSSLSATLKIINNTSIWSFSTNDYRLYQSRKGSNAHKWMNPIRHPDFFFQRIIENYTESKNGIPRVWVHGTINVKKVFCVFPFQNFKRNVRYLF